LAALLGAALLSAPVRATDDAADRAEAAAVRAETAADRSEEAAARVEHAIERLEHLLEVVTRDADRSVPRPR
jgi:C4-dicarboxylate-specific signal transduction histidine kinase